MKDNSEYIKGWNDALIEMKRVINANSRTGMHYDYYANYGIMLKEEERVMLVNKIKGMMKNTDEKSN